jgi:hypothetical protein
LREQMQAMPSSSDEEEPETTHRSQS